MVGVGSLGVVIWQLIQRQVLVRLEVPIHGEDRGHGGHNRPGKLYHVVNPVAVLGLVLALNHIQRSDKAHLAIDNHQLAVIAQVRAAEAALVQLDGQHEMPVDAYLR